MAVTADPGPRRPRTYGNWRRPQSGGMYGLGAVGMMILIVGAMVTMLATLVGVLFGIALGFALVVLLIPLAIKNADGRTLLSRGAARVAWRRTVASGAHLYRSGPLGRTGYGTCTLPGLAARSELTEAQDAYGRPFALLTYPSTNHHVIVISCEADGASLVDQDQADTWVAHWGDWLARLGTEPGLVGASVTVETAPDTGNRLNHEIESQRADDAPPLAQQMLTEVLETYPAGSAQISTRIALTYSGAARHGIPRRDVGDMAVELGNRLPELTSTLAMTGAGTARPMTATDLAEAVRVAYDPAVSSLMEDAREAGGSGLTWEDAGPIGTEEAWDSYRHDSAFSVSWSMSAAPRGEVLSSVLTGLLLPQSEIDRKRVTLLYRPHDPASAAKTVEEDVRHATFRAGQARPGAAREAIEVRATKQSAQEEAAGAGVTRFALLVTATVSDADRLPRARALTQQLAPPARIRLRTVAGSQAAAFAAGLPIGLVLPLHLTIPTTIRDNL